MVWKALKIWVANFLAMALVGACANANAPSGAIDDPLEPINRPIHEFNKGLDNVLLRPVSKAYDFVTTPEIQERVAKASANINEPRNVVNHLLQGEIEPAAINTTRFVLNSTVGLLGFADPASSFGLFPTPTNFNQTLAKWGVPSGPYVELPIFGPNTVRSAVGFVADTQLNPLTHTFNNEQYTAYNYFVLLSRVNDRARYGNLIEMLLYETPDSYLASRLAYLQNQRFVNESVSEEAASDTVELENFYE